MEIIHALILGLIQGLTEFLPVSSSGHLALAQVLFDMKVSTGVIFEIVVHFGTLCSIFIYYRSEILDLIKALPLWLKPSSAWQHAHARMILFIIVSMIPALIIALFFKEMVEAWFVNPIIVSSMLILTGTILFATRFQKESSENISLKKSLGIGLAQAFAILPGISRSGSTISMALFLGMKKKDAANFSFLMVIPVIFGAMILAMKDLSEAGEVSAQAIPLFVGFLASFASGYIALKLLIGLLKSRGIYPFAWYCWLVGLGSLVWFLSH
jgi:undecaprenyl-diphosphatase